MFELFYDFDSDIICVEDLDIVIDGALITHIMKVGRKISIWSGDPDDKHSVELIVTPYQRRKIYKQIIEEMG